jgi:mannose-1-phosphate guanylyltransferase/mannose-1-phosphate guanylyltransferase/mannose-6-phosphate isomerase
MELPHYKKDVRPWGNFEQFTANEPSTVKIITVQKGEALSLQIHQHRDEFWRILSGTGTVTIGDSLQPVSPGDHVYFPRTTQHRAEAGAEDLVFLEIAFGDFDENDIVRLEDKYYRT